MDLLIRYMFFHMAKQKHGLDDLVVAERHTLLELRQMNYNKNGMSFTYKT